MEPKSFVFPYHKRNPGSSRRLGKRRGHFRICLVYSNTGIIDRNERDQSRLTDDGSSPQTTGAVRETSLTTSAGGDGRLPVTVGPRIYVRVVPGPNASVLPGPLSVFPRSSVPEDGKVTRIHFETVNDKATAEWRRDIPPVLNIKTKRSSLDPALTGRPFKILLAKRLSST